MPAFLHRNKESPAKKKKKNCANSFPPGGVPRLYLQFSSWLVLSCRSRKSGSPAQAPVMHFSCLPLLRKKVTRRSISLVMTSYSRCHPGQHIPSKMTICGPLLFPLLTFEMWKLSSGRQKHFTCLVDIWDSAMWLQSLPPGGKGGPYLHWRVNTATLFSTSTAK